MIVLLGIAGCNGTEVVPLNFSSEETVDSDAFVPGPKDNGSGDISDAGETADSGEISDDRMNLANLTGAEIPPTEETPGVIIEGNGELKQELCPEQVLLAIKSCEKLNGYLNITLKNQLSNVSMIFYYLYDNLIVSEEHSDEIVPSKEVRSYLINFKEVEDQYGEVGKIEATPIYTKADGSMIACSNKKLPVIVKYSCN